MLARHCIGQLFGLAMVGILGLSVNAAVELRDAELVAGGSPVLQNAAGTVRLEDARVGRVGATVFVPEPGTLWQLGAGIGGLVLLYARRRRVAARSSSTTGA